MVKLPWEETCWSKKTESSSKYMGSIFHSMAISRYRALTEKKRKVSKTALWSHHSFMPVLLTVFQQLLKGDLMIKPSHAWNKTFKDNQP